ncbi:MAG: hypothetical protein GXO86_08865 [Chlorobi bacterium]|nr:hypothetical protein [Chlorobiota bacterium]
MKLRFAFAVDSEGHFKKKHFGDADRFLIYEIEGDNINLIAELDNNIKLQYDENVHGLPKKGKAIIAFLKDHDVNILVSKQFGKNITLVSSHFIPVIITKETLEEVIEVIRQHIKWLEDEMMSHKENHRLFRIDKGILKLSIGEK